MLPYWVAPECRGQGLELVPGWEVLYGRLDQGVDHRGGGFECIVLLRELGAD